MDIALLETALKYIGVGGGGGLAIGIVVLSILFRQGKDNKTSIVELEGCSKEHGKRLDRHDLTLKELGTNQKHIIRTQGNMDQKLDKLINLHMNGGKKNG